VCDALRVGVGKADAHVGREAVALHGAHSTMTT
jgi:hypothetical protein